MKKALVILAILALMIAEYRFIMGNLCPYNVEPGVLCVEFMGNVDFYAVEE